MNPQEFWEYFDLTRLFLSNALLLIFVILLFFGLWGMIRFKTTYGRLLNSSKIDSVAVIFFMTAMFLRASSMSVAVKLAVALIFYLLTNPVVNQLIAYAAKKQAMEQARLDEGRTP